MIGELLNRCIAEGTYPSNLKNIKVQPIYKGKGEKQVLKNYRPISLIPIISKVLESLMSERLMAYFIDNGLLNKHQFAYQSGRSTVDATREVMSKIVSHLEAKRKVAAIFCDLSRAFELVNHSLLLAKLRRYGISGNFLDTIASFLHNRKQCTQVRENRSDMEEIGDSSVPQGSITGNILFLFLINDITAAADGADYVLFADDGCVMVAADDVTQLKAKLCLIMEKLSNWFTVNGMMLNLEKTNIVHFQLRNQHKCELNITCGGVSIPQAVEIKYLGFVLDAGLTWSAHIDFTCGRLAAACHALARLAPSLTVENKKTAYFGYFQSILSYGIDLWGLAADRERALRLQKRAIRIIAGAGWAHPAQNLFKELKILTVPCLYILEVSKYVRCNLDQLQTNAQHHNSITRHRNHLHAPATRLVKDGTGIKFNKDADRMNAEAKKKVDVLSEELLPYIIAEQERRTTLHKRVMTAIQNGEKGVTIAEIRNKPPLIIRKGLFYRCPANRAPKEPDGSGVLACEDDIVPTQVMYDSCLSAEDRELFNADNKFFFCNRHKIEGPDLPRNGSTVIGCAPIERTSLNYTTAKCTLEDTDDVVVHYRYYPDRTYKYVTELDPDHEVCDHWNPCQIGYIYSLPSADMATPASELWPEVRERPDEYERDEIVEAVPEDNMQEHVPGGTKEYTSSPRIVKLPSGSKRSGGGRSRKSFGFMGMFSFQGVALRDSSGTSRRISEKHYSSRYGADQSSITLTLTFSHFSSAYFGTYFAIVRNTVTNTDIMLKFLVLELSSISLIPISMDCIHGQKMNTTVIPFRCNRCHLSRVMIRAPDQSISNADTAKYRITQQTLELEIENPRPQDFGDYFAVFINGDGQEERVKVATVRSPEIDVDNVIQINRADAALSVGDHYDKTMHYECEECDLTDILCNGESVIAAGRVSIINVSKMISFNFPRFDDSNACVYMGFFKHKDKVYAKVLAVIENNSPGVKISNFEKLDPPKEGESFEHTVNFVCEDCSTSKVFVNGISLESMSRRQATESGMGSFAFFAATASTISIRITEYRDTYYGVYQAKFETGQEQITKNIMEFTNSSQQSSPSNETISGSDKEKAPDTGEKGSDKEGGTDGEKDNADATTEATNADSPKEEGSADEAKPEEETKAERSRPESANAERTNTDGSVKAEMANKETKKEGASNAERAKNDDSSRVKTATTMAPNAGGTPLS